MTAFMPTCNCVRVVAVQTVSLEGFSATGGVVVSGVGVSVGVGVDEGGNSLVSVGEGVACGVDVVVGGREVEVEVGDEITATSVDVERGGSAVPEGSKA